MAALFFCALLLGERLHFFLFLDTIKVNKTPRFNDKKERKLEAMGSFFQDTWLGLVSVVKNFNPIIDVLDILVISFIIYKGIQLVRETRAEQLLKGILLILVITLAAFLLNMKTLNFLMSNILQIGIFALIVLFQPEIRRALERLGRARMGNVFTAENARHAGEWEPVIPIIVSAVDRLSKTVTGALIVIERQIKLGEQIATGVILNATPSVELFGNIFYNKTPLHDGAVIMRDGQILAAACFLPKPQKEELIATHFGSRHRAAIGMSEVSDAIVIVVSEETGTVSVVVDGKMERGFDSARLTRYLQANLIGSGENDKSVRDTVVNRLLRKGKKPKRKKNPKQEEKDG